MDLVTSEEKVKKLVVQPSFKQLKIFNENLAAGEWAKVELTLNQPTYVEFAILDLLKIWVPLQLHQERVSRLNAVIYYYRFLKNQIQTDNVCEDFYADKLLFNFSNYEKENPFCDNTNKKLLIK